MRLLTTRNIIKETRLVVDDEFPGMFNLVYGLWMVLKLLLWMPHIMVTNWGTFLLSLRLSNEFY